MATTINKFKVTNDLKKLELIVTAGVGETVTSIKLWTDKTYKDNTKSIDFNSKIIGTSNVEDIEIDASELGVSDLLDIYFIEIETSEIGEEPKLGVTVDFTRFQICITDLLCKVAKQPVPVNHELHNALTYRMYIQSLRHSILEGRYRLAIGFFSNLEKACSSRCKICCDLSEIAKKGLGFSTLDNELILF